MTTVTLTVAPDQTPQEEASLVARVAAAIAETTGDDVHVEVVKTEHVKVAGSVADRMRSCARWSA